VFIGKICLIKKQKKKVKNKRRQRSKKCLKKLIKTKELSTLHSGRILAVQGTCKLLGGGGVGGCMQC
jgi:hypothetical protein